MRNLSDIIVSKRLFEKKKLVYTCNLHKIERNETDVDNILENYDLDDDTVLDINNEDLVDRYKYWNKELFENKLPVLKEISFKGLSKNVTGKTTVEVLAQKDSNIIEEMISGVINLTKYAKYTKRVLDVVLISQMTHIYFCYVEKVNVFQNSIYKNKLDQLSNKLSYEIPTDKIITKFDPDNNSLNYFTIFVIKTSKKLFICLYPRKKFEVTKDEIIPYLKNHFDSDKQHSEIEIYMGIGKTGLSQKLPIQRNFTDIKLDEIQESDYKDIKWKFDVESNTLTNL